MTAMGLRKKEQWLDHAQAMIEATSVAKAAERCGVHPTTAFRWRHRFLGSPALDKPKTLRGIVEADETFILESFKGRRSDLPRPPRKRGGKAKHPGLFFENIPILVAREDILFALSMGAKRAARSCRRRRRPSGERRLERTASTAGPSFSSNRRDSHEMTAKRHPLADASELCRLDVGELTTGFAAGKFTALDVARATIARAKEIQSQFNPFSLIDEEAALAMARDSTARWRAGAPLSPIDGVPTTIKDIVWVKGRPIRYGSRTTSEAPCSRDAPSVKRLRAGGAVFLGITTTPEFGWKAVTDNPLTGLTRNPWDWEMTPGGSSGGAVVAAATGAGVLHIGTDGGGSIRIPCSFTGVTGLKPTFGRVAAYPASAFGTLAHIGPIARSAHAAAAMLKVMAGRDLDDWNQGAGDLGPIDLEEDVLKESRIGLWMEPPAGRLDAEVAAAVTKAALVLESLGAGVV